MEDPTLAPADVPDYQLHRCEQCPWGKYSSEYDQIQCNECATVDLCKRPNPEEEYQFTDKDQTQCMTDLAANCLEGNEYTCTDLRCTPCRAGKYRNAPMSIRQVDGVGGCQYCDASNGDYSDKGSSECSTCPEGKYVSLWKNASEIECNDWSTCTIEKSVQQITGTQEKLCSFCTDWIPYLDDTIELGSFFVSMNSTVKDDVMQYMCSSEQDNEENLEWNSAYSSAMSFHCTTPHDEIQSRYRPPFVGLERIQGTLYNGNVDSNGRAWTAFDSDGRERHAVAFTGRQCNVMRCRAMP